MRDWARDTDGGATLTVRVTPRASRSGVSGVIGEGAGAILKIALAAPPVDGKANAELVGYVAEVLDVPRSQVEVIAGKQSKNKVIRIKNKHAAEVTAAFARFLPDN